MGSDTVDGVGVVIEVRYRIVLKLDFLVFHVFGVRVHGVVGIEGDFFCDFVAREHIVFFIGEHIIRRHVWVFEVTLTGGLMVSLEILVCVRSMYIFTR